MTLNYSWKFSKHVVDPIGETPHIACSRRVSPTASKGEALFTMEPATRLLGLASKYNLSIKKINNC